MYIFGSGQTLLSQTVSTTTLVFTLVWQPLYGLPILHSVHLLFPQFKQVNLRPGEPTVWQLACKLLGGTKQADVLKVLCLQRAPGCENCNWQGRAENKSAGPRSPSRSKNLLGVSKHIHTHTHSHTLNIDTHTCSLTVPASGQDRVPHTASSQQ